MTEEAISLWRFLRRNLNGKIADFKIKTLHVKINISIGKRRAKDNDAANNSMDPPFGIFDIIEMALAIGS